MKYMKNNDYQFCYRTLLFITKAVWFAYKGPNKNDNFSEEFIKRHALNTANFHRETGPVNLDPRNYFKMGFKYFSKYNAEEELLIWRCNDPKPVVVANDIWNLYKETENLSSFDYTIHVLSRELYYDFKNTKYYYLKKFSKLKNFLKLPKFYSSYNK